MNRIYAIMLALLLGACWNDDSPEETPADNTASQGENTEQAARKQPESSQGESKEKVYSLEGHPLAKYNKLEDYGIHHLITNLYSYTSLADQYFDQNCVVLPECEEGRDEYKRAVAFYEKEGRLPDGMTPIDMNNYYRQCMPEGVEEKCQSIVNDSVTRLQYIGRTDITEAHLRNPAYWRLQREILDEYQALRALAESRLPGQSPYLPDDSPELTNEQRQARVRYSAVVNEAEKRLQRFKEGAY